MKNLTKVLNKAMAKAPAAAAMTSFASFAPVKSIVVNVAMSERSESRRSEREFETD